MRLPIPTGHLAPILTADIIFGGSFGLTANVKGDLKLHNFLSAKEKKYVSGSIDGSLTVNAKVYVGMAVQVLHVAQAAVKMVLEAGVASSLKGDANLNKGNATNLASFDLECNGDFKFDLKGYFELTIGLTPTLVWLSEHTTGYTPEASFKSPKLLLVTAERNAKFNFHMPFQSTNTTIPDDQFNISKGEWTVTYPAANMIKKYLEEHIVGNDLAVAKKWLADTGTLSAAEQEALLKEYDIILTEPNT